METKPETIKVGRVLRTSSSGLLMPPHLMFPCSPKSGKALLAIWAYNFIPCSAFFLCTRKGIGAVVFFSFSALVLHAAGLFYVSGYLNR